MGCCASCFGGQTPEEIEREKLASEEVRQNAAKAAQQRQEQFEKSAAGRAARAQIAMQAKQSANSNTGEPVLKWQMG
ncbi:hypothetical protein SUGI_0541160 [Cryptomeria japonica]|uniref:uncharacterized protein LOC131042558 n=1 Tax=Cryptomeria japonica TaxID=3369 RepID=UPI002408D1CB|nr:uncharacterized protein LOC131042558 [Cryptomeria japonica]XP_057831856.1 uncharacterized protein LOC131042558 [Cryptomeria japonica]GLJ27588.1 hypothetical protein SUGI_0541160 [Cryptomeria japonica]